MEIKADVILKATKVDGIYDADPEVKDPNPKFNAISYHGRAQTRPCGDGFHRDLVCVMENNLPIMIFDLNTLEYQARVAGEKFGIVMPDPREMITRRHSGFPGCSFDIVHIPKDIAL